MHNKLLKNLVLLPTNWEKNLLYKSDDCPGSYVRVTFTKIVAPRPGFLRQALVLQVLRHLAGLQREDGPH